MKEAGQLFVSSQVGFAMNCQICYAGWMGLKRNLSTTEIVEQAVFTPRLLSADIGANHQCGFHGGCVIFSIPFLI